MDIDLALYRNEMHVASRPLVRLSAIDISPDRPQRTLVFIHGFGGKARQWVYQLQKFSLENRVIALDLLGHGGSAHPPLIEDYTTENVFLHLAAWVETLDLREPAVLVGHSLGGYLALLYALRFPERVGALILVNPFFSVRQLSPILQLVFKRPLLNTSIIERVPYRLFRIVIDVTSLRFGGGGDGIHTLPESVRIQTALDYKRAAPGIYNISRTLRDLTPELPRVTMPVRVLWGERDQSLAPGSFSELVHALPNARAEAIPVCGHVPHQCHAARFNQLVLDFLTPNPPLVLTSLMC